VILGQHKYTVDPKGRVPLSAQHLEQLTGSLVLTVGYNRCIWILSEKDFRKAEARLSDTELFNPKALRLQRQFLGCAEFTKPDSQKRVRIPELLREMAGIDDENKTVVMVGVGSHVECWEKGRWMKYFDDELTDENLVEDARIQGFWRDDGRTALQNGGEQDSDSD
jgi:MraZ protein